VEIKVFLIYLLVYGRIRIRIREALKLTDPVEYCWFLSREITVKLLGVAIARDPDGGFHNLFSSSLESVLRPRVFSAESGIWFTRGARQ
jgi:hypothetical protein